MMGRVIDTSPGVEVVRDGEQIICKVKREGVKSVAQSMRDKGHVKKTQ